MNHNKPIITFFSFALFVSSLASCAGEDRSNERPLAPVVKTLGAQVNSDVCVMSGMVSESHNSSLRECGFVYWQPDSASNKVQADSAGYEFAVTVDSLAQGEYNYTAYARNGISTSYGDTLQFTVNN